jgi:transposase
MEEAMNRTSVSYTGKTVFIGIDVHRSFFVLSCLCEGVVVKRCRMPARAEAIISFISRHFAGAQVQTCYEAGYSGFWLHRALEAASIPNIVVHAAHVAVEARNRVKTDKRDSLRLAEQLAAGRLRGIRIPTPEQEQRRLLTRTREQLVSARHRVQAQIRLRLHQFGLFPEEVKRAIHLKDVEALLNKMESADLKLSIGFLYAQWQHLAGNIKDLDRHLVEQAKQDSLEAVYRSVPGIGPLTARVLSNELGDMGQFANERALYSFTGLTPGEYSSGDKVCRGHISRQGSPRVRHMLVEAAWMAVRKDKVLSEYFAHLAVRIGKKRAIVAVARKLIGRIRAAFKAGGLYQVAYKKAA